jgi:REP element-mobilizing transposase RayT
MSQRRQLEYLREIYFKNCYRIPSARMRGWNYAWDGFYFITICVKNRFHCLAKILQGEVHLSPIGGIIAEEWEKTAEIRENVELDAWVIMPDHVHGIIGIFHPDTINSETPRRENDGITGWEPVETPRRENDGITGWEPVETPHRGNEGITGWEPVETPRRENDGITGWEPVETPHRGVSTPNGAAYAAWKPNSLGSIIGQFKSKTTKRIRAAGFGGFAWQARFYDHIIRDRADLDRIRRYIQENPTQWEMDWSRKIKNTR